MCVTLELSQSQSACSKNIVKAISNFVSFMSLKVLSDCVFRTKWCRIKCPCQTCSICTLFRRQLTILESSKNDNKQQTRGHLSRFSADSAETLPSVPLCPLFFCLDVDTIWHCVLMLGFGSLKSPVLLC